MPAQNTSSRWYRTLWRFARRPLWFGLGVFAGFMLPYMLALDARVRQRFGDLVLSVPTRVYARPLLLAPGEAMKPDALQLELRFAGYREGDGGGRLPGTWTHSGSDYLVSTRGYAGPEGGELPQRLKITLGHGQIEQVRNIARDSPVKGAHLDPARIATLYGAAQEERQVVDLRDLPPLLVTGLQAVEDRDFKHHYGIDVSAILRAAWVNMRAGHVVQGGSTLTQQLVRNLFLDRSQSLVRKVNEALLALLIEAHYDKGRILKAYVNEVFLGQQGNQAVHGFAAASEFYFGRRPDDLRPQDIALLIGLVRGPSYYDPRRFPARARARRDTVLREFELTGLISRKVLERAMAAPLDISSNPQLPHNRFPAFMQMVRAQLTADFDEHALRSEGLAVFTTLDPAAQLYAERALTHTLDEMGKRARVLQGAAVVTDAGTGSVLAVVGGRDADAPGFNRALQSRRPVGSLIKPFVYLVALTQPDRWSLATLIPDTPVRLRQPNGKLWTPENDDHQTHGEVPLIDALVHSWNLATVHLGMDIGVDRVAALLKSFGLRQAINPNPSMLLGAVDLSPLQVARLYQYFAADGHALPLNSLSGVVDAKGHTIKRYQVRPGSGEYRAAADLVTYAMQRVTESGTAHAIAASGLGWLHPAGKTGTSDSQRDSWFAGFTGKHLAVVWVGRDDNKPTGLWGATGALRVWIDLFKHLPTRALSPEPGPDLQMAWVDTRSGRLTESECNNARELPFIPGHLPREREHCFWQRIRSVFGNNGSHGPDRQQPQP